MKASPKPMCSLEPVNSGKAQRSLSKTLLNSKKLLHLVTKISPYAAKNPPEIVVVFEVSQVA
jgi:hypothetical protein